MNQPRPFRAFALALAAAATLALPLAARADGVTDFVIDPAAGFTISSPGSYALAADAAMTDGAVNAITVAANDVTIDLNGHTIAGAGGSGSGVGVNAGASARVAIRNGRIRTFGYGGVLGTGSSCSATDLVVSNCGVKGIGLQGEAASVIRCKAEQHAGHGILVGSAALVEDCEAIRNNFTGQAAGIQAAFGSTVRNCRASLNSPSTPDGWGAGIFVALGCVVEDCIVYQNKGAFDGGDAFGIQAADNCTIRNNVCTEQGAGSAGGSAYGIQAGDSCRVVGNVCNRATDGANGNGEAVGISIGGGSGLVEGNTCERNRAVGAGLGRGIVVSGPGTVVRNNTASYNEGAGGGSTGYGVYVLAASGDNLIEGNHCAGNKGDAGVGTGYGVFVDANAVVVRGNVTSGNQSGGIALNAMGIAGARCRAERNRCAESVAVFTNGTHSLGSGEDANISYMN